VQRNFQANTTRFFAKFFEMERNVTHQSGSLYELLLTKVTNHDTVLDMVVNFVMNRQQMYSQCMFVSTMVVTIVAAEGFLRNGNVALVLRTIFYKHSTSFTLFFLKRFSWALKKFPILKKIQKIFFFN
jgi:hypothetical protein